MNKREAKVIRVLHIDDNMHDLELVRDSLEIENEGFTVTGASSRLLVDKPYDRVQEDINALFSACQPMIRPPHHQAADYDKDWMARSRDWRHQEQRIHHVLEYVYRPEEH